MMAEDRFAHKKSRKSKEMIAINGLKPALCLNILFTSSEFDCDLR
jgi:hypothetical protein